MRVPVDEGGAATATADGPPGTRIAGPVRCVPMLSGTIVLVSKQTTHAVLPSGLIVMACGFLPTRIGAPALSLTRLTGVTFPVFDCFEMASTT